MYAFFNNLPERGGGDMEPTIKVPTPEQATKLKQLEATLAGHQSVLAQPLARFEAECEQWETPLRREIERKPAGSMAGSGSSRTPPSSADGSEFEDSK